MIAGRPTRALGRALWDEFVIAFTVNLVVWAFVLVLGLVGADISNATEVAWAATGYMVVKAVQRFLAGSPRGTSESVTASASAE